MNAVAIRDVFGDALVEAGKSHQDIVVVSCDLKGATRTKKFFDAFPERSFEVGIAEANGLGICAGLALAGFRPFISSFGAFITGKNVEIRISIAYNKAPVVIVGTHGGLIGPDGTTQAGLQDIAAMRAIPHFIVLQPASPIETRAMVKYLGQSRDLAYLRITKNALKEIYSHDYQFILGKGHEIRPGRDFTIISSGPCIHAAVEAAELLNPEIDCRVINLPTLKPVDQGIILKCAQETRGIMTVEDHTIEGGLGSIVAEVVAGHGKGGCVYRHGIKDVFTESGTSRELEEKYELDAAGIIKNIRKCVY